MSDLAKTDKMPQSSLNTKEFAPEKIMYEQNKIWTKKIWT